MSIYDTDVFCEKLIKQMKHMPDERIIEPAHDKT